MHIQTTRFGVVTIDPEHVMTFPQGMLGIGEGGAARFALLESEEWGPFYWLQSADDPQLAFLVVDPALFFKDYQVCIREETQTDLDLADAKEGQLLVICNRAGEWLTGNLLGPLVINTRTRVGQQVVLTEKKWTCRQPLIRLEAHEAAEPMTTRAAA
jgi:flagellar assembly factor FliW